MNAIAVADHDDGDVTEHPTGRLLAGESGDGHDIVPAGLDEVGDRLGLVGPGTTLATS